MDVLLGDRLPRTGIPNRDSYLAMLDQVLLDRHVSATEADALVELAYELGLHRAEVVELHHGYLRALARAVWSDDVVTGAERADLAEVAVLLGLDERAANQMVDEETPTARSEAPSAGLRVGEFVMEPGDIVVLTGEMSVSPYRLGTAGDESRALCRQGRYQEDETARRR